MTRKGEHALAEEAKRKAREAEALRANLKKRKSQARGRAAKETEVVGKRGLAEAGSRLAGGGRWARASGVGCGGNRHDGMVAQPLGAVHP